MVPLMSKGIIRRLILMSRTAPGVCMFGIKLVGHNFPSFSFHGRGGKPTLMNFPDSPEGRRIAADIPIGHKSLVYLMAPVKRFCSAIEYIKWDANIGDVLEDGARAADAQGAIAMIKVVNSRFAKNWRCVRVVAWIDNPIMAPTPDFGFKEGDIMREITQREYIEMFNGIPWTWTDACDESSSSGRGRSSFPI